MSGKVGIDDGDKVLLPASALDSLARMNVDCTFLAKLPLLGSSHPLLYALFHRPDVISR
jgi:hypothetical protein